LIFLFSSFNQQTSNQLLLTDFLNSVGQLKYRGTSVLFRLNTSIQDLLRICKSVISICCFSNQTKSILDDIKILKSIINMIEVD
jgi:hypothetical protein